MTAAADRWAAFMAALDELPPVERVAVLAHSLLLLLFAFYVSARLFSGCLRRASAAKNGGAVAGGDGGDRPGPSNHDVVIGNGYRVALLCCCYALVLQAAALGFEAAEKRWLCMVLPAAQCLAWLVLCCSVLHCKVTARGRYPFLIRAWWCVSFVLCIGTLFYDTRELIRGSAGIGSRAVANVASLPALVLLCFSGIRGVTGIEVSGAGDLLQPLLEEEPGCLKVTPYSEAGVLSQATLSWLNPLLGVGAKRPLELKDIPLLAPKDRSKTCFKVVNSNWERLKAENPSKQPSLAMAIFRSFWKEAAWNAVFAGLNTLVSYVGPFLISYFVDYL